MKTLFAFAVTIMIFLLFSCKKENFIPAATSSGLRNDKVVTDLTPIILATNTEAVFAFDIKAFKTLWSLSSTDGQWSTGPIVNGDAMYIASHHNVYKITISRRNIIWQHKYYFDGNVQDSVLPLAFCSNSIVVASKLHESDTSAVAKIVALDTSTGKVMWKQDFNLKDINMRITAPAVYSGNIWIGIGPKLIALNGVTGEVMWQKKFDKTNLLLAPCITNNLVYTGTCKNRNDSVYGLNPSTGSIQWSSPLPDKFPGVYNTFLCIPTVYNDQLLINGHNKIISFNAINGVKNWEYEQIDNGGLPRNDIFKPICVPNIAHYIDATNIDAALRVTLKADGSMLTSFGHGVNSGYPISLAAPVVVQYPNEQQGYFIYCLNGTNFNICIQDDTNGYWYVIGTFYTSKPFINLVVYDDGNNVFYSSDSGMRQ